MFSRYFLLAYKDAMGKHVIGKVQVSNICSPLACRASLLITKVLRLVRHSLLLVNPCRLFPVILLLLILKITSG